MTSDLEQLLQEAQADPSAPEDIADRIYEAEGIRFLLDKFGDSVLHAADDAGNTVANLTARWCQTDEPLQLLSEALSSAGWSVCEFFTNPGAENACPLHCAAKNPSIAALQWLMQLLGAEYLRSPDASHCLPVHYSALYQCPDALELYKREAGLSIFEETTSRERTVFHCAAMNESADNLRWLISELDGEGSFLVARDISGNTPVHLAAWCQDVDTMELLKEHLGEEMFDLSGEDGETLAHSAAQNTQSGEVLAWCIREMGPERLATADCWGKTVTHRAAENQTAESLQLLFEALGRPCLEAVDSSGRSAVHYAATNTASDSALRWIVDLLGPSCLVKETDAQGIKPVHLMARHLDTEALDYLDSLDYRLVFRTTDRDGRTLVHYAAENELCRDMLAWCVSHLEDPMWLQEEDLFGKSPLYIASGRKPEYVIE
ncbi:hypothetical protein BOX15_Mlig013546g1 [Macrostomum lignano]|uniref:Uncharacterized protein n=1 Tax=Macrostomum lignano TaxID=282301 RepID=A0A267EGX3_9PLAT|nr:hypothetical protein BOX15_Mlig013546g1 [Macrostomum lignano]